VKHRGRGSWVVPVKKILRFAVLLRQCARPNRKAAPPLDNYRCYFSIASRQMVIVYQYNANVQIFDSRLRLGLRRGYQAEGIANR
jgi:hypothetical protein